jgi:hypothetical protein
MVLKGSKVFTSSSVPQNSLALMKIISMFELNSQQIFHLFKPAVCSSRTFVVKLLELASYLNRLHVKPILYVS